MRVTYRSRSVSQCCVTLHANTGSRQAPTCHKPQGEAVCVDGKGRAQESTRTKGPCEDAGHGRHTWPFMPSGITKTACCGSWSIAGSISIAWRRSKRLERVIQLERGHSIKCCLALRWRPHTRTHSTSSSWPQKHRGQEGFIVGIHISTVYMHLVQHRTPPVCAGYGHSQESASEPALPNILRRRLVGPASRGRWQYGHVATRRRHARKKG